ncbi:heavy metal translocating P-type ATPase [Liquorilactobacillus hordei]|uniref:heavy metal translocating P-type ATPase n=1 Tax=Liquorilactobacillus hordei TaxID=468911 RepID=UPI001CBA9A85|nr:heavy metal translocating P-type ATPase [Liquorilactobacillus hordei]MBZ2406071.1 heavy metal translocating P-type ATPase [Liquorilactobacillus hordei]
MNKFQIFFKKYERMNVMVMLILLLVAKIVHYLYIIPVGYSVLMVIVSILGGTPIAIRAFEALRYKVISIELLVISAALGALIIGEFDEAAIVVWLFNLGNILETITLKKTRSAVRNLAEMAPQIAFRVKGARNSDIEEVEIDSINEGDRLLVKTGAQVPVDGVVVEGRGYTNEASITGESRRLGKQTGDKVFAGTILEDGTLIVQTKRVGEDTTFGKIIELVEEAQDSKIGVQKTIDKFAKYYTPLVIILAITVGLIFSNFKLGITILVLGCPGALVIGVPVSTVAGIGSAARKGILAKGSDSFQVLKSVDMLIFDKTGTITKGEPEITGRFTYNGIPAENASIFYSIERESNHPLARVITEEFSDSKLLSIDTTTVIKGQGIKAAIEGIEILLGNEQLLMNGGVNLKAAATVKLEKTGQSFVYLAVNGELREVLTISDALRENIAEVFNHLKQLGFNNLTILSGDNLAAVQQVGQKLGVKSAIGDLLPVDKVAKIKEYQNAGHRVAFIGDGINDSPALATADIGIAMGSGTDVALDVSDIVLMNSDLDKLPIAIRFSRRVIKNMTENIIIAIAVVFLLFGGLLMNYIYLASGMLVHELSILIVILNGMRLLK